MKHCRLGVLATHPIHYQVQLYKRLGQTSPIDVTMLFCSRFGLTQSVDPTFGVAVKWYDGEILDGCKHKFLAKRSRSPTTFFVNFTPGVLREITNGGYDVLLIQGYAGATDWLGILAAKTRSCRLLFRGETVLRSCASTAREVARGLAIQALSKSIDVFLPIGSRSRDFYLHYGIAPDRLVLSPYAVDNEFFFGQASLLQHRRTDIRKQLGISADIPVVLYVSKLIPRKRPLHLLRAFELVDTPAALVFVGDGPLKAEIERQVARRGMRNVLCLGFQHQHNLAQFYAIADVFVLPSEYEPWGLVVNEAMCFSLPVITTNGVSASQDLLVNGENGFVYEAGNTEALRDALEQLLGDRNLRLKMGQRSSDIIRQWDQAASAQGIRRAISLAMAG